MRNLKITTVKDKRLNRKKPWIVRWYAEYDPMTDTQKRHSKSFAKRRHAEQYAKQLQNDYEQGISFEHKKITLEEMCSKFLKVKKNSYKPASYKHYKETMGRLKSYFNPKTPLCHINDEYAEQFYNDIDYVRSDLKNKGKSISDSARNLTLRNCKKIFSTAVKWKYLRTNPFEDVKQVKPQTQPWHYITPDEFQSILNVCEDPYKRAYYAVQYGCGLRAGEAINLLWDGINIDFETSRITVVNRTPSPDIPPFSIKDFDSRSIPMPDLVISCLIELQEHAPEHTPFVFLTEEKWNTVKARWERTQRAGEQWDKSILLTNTLRDFKRCCKRAGIKTHEKLCQHCMRKSWATNLGNARTPEKTLMEMGGWSSTECCQKYYLKSTDANEQKAVQVLNGLFENCQSTDANKDRARQVLDELMGE